MEQLIKKIIEVDKKARKRTEESKQQLAESKIAIAQRVEELEKQYNESVEEIITLTTEEENEKVLAKKAALDEKYARAESALEQTYEQHKGQWVKELVERSVQVREANSF